MSGIGELLIKDQLLPAVQWQEEGGVMRSSALCFAAMCSTRRTQSTHTSHTRRDVSLHFALFTFVGDIILCLNKNASAYLLWLHVRIYKLFPNNWLKQATIY